MHTNKERVNAAVVLSKGKPYNRQIFIQRNIHGYFLIGKINAKTFSTDEFFAKKSQFTYKNNKIEEKKKTIKNAENFIVHLKSI